ISDEVDLDFQVATVNIDAGNIEQVENTKSKSVQWKLSDVPLNETINAYLRYIGDKKYDLTHFSVQSDLQAISSTTGDHGMTIHKREPIIMPLIYQDDVDT
ncbi:MAG: hypothetical protein ACXADH_07795, partial [Candidatus Kariarchaeaceae archaeon]